MQALTTLAAKAAAVYPSATAPIQPAGLETKQIVGLIAAVVVIVIAASSVIVSARSGRGNVRGALAVGGVNMIAILQIVIALGVGALIAWMTGVFDVIF